MSENTNIEWCDHTFNPWIGCTAISPGCTNCYAADWAKRYGRDFSVRTKTKTWRDPIKWNSAHDSFFAEHHRRQRVFCASLADVFDNEVDPQWRADLFDLIAQTPRLDWLLLTKRIGNVKNMAPHLDTRHPNVWLGATIVNQMEADRDIPKLLATPARIRFLSIEPMLGPIDLAPWLEHQANGKPLIHWVVAGGESGPKARPMHPDWPRSLRDQCATAGVPFLFKQWGEWYPGHIDSEDDTIQLPDGSCATLSDESGNECIKSHCWNSGWADPLTTYSISARIGKKSAGRLLDGVLHDGYPAEVTNVD